MWTTIGLVNDDQSSEQRSVEWKRLSDEQATIGQAKIGRVSDDRSSEYISSGPDFEVWSPSKLIVMNHGLKKFNLTAM